MVVTDCNIHDWMTAYVAVIDSPWFARSQANGRGDLANLPAGRYTLRVWHAYQTAQLAPQSIEPEGASWRRELQLGLDIAPPPRKPRQTSGETY